MSSSAVAVAEPGPPAGPTVPEAAPPLNIPSLGRRVAIGGLRAFFVLLALGILPLTALGVLGSAGLTTGVPRTTLLVVAIVLGLLSALAYIARPTKLFGPVSAVASVISLAYLLYLAPLASFGFAVGNQGSLAIDFGPLVRLLAIVPVFSLLAAIVITIEDFARPGERIAYVYAVIR